jgi:hypothetical protein
MHAEVTVPSLDDWEKQLQQHPQGVKPPIIVAVDFQSQPARSDKQDGLECMMRVERPAC